LTNVAKHSGANAVEILVHPDGERVLVSVSDNGIGGADQAKGRGLAGLADRLRSLDASVLLREGLTLLLAEAGHQVVAQLMSFERRRDPIKTLTAREREVLALMAQRHSNQAIAERLAVTVGAVEKHTQRIFAKLDLAPDEAQHRRVLAVLTYLRS